MNPDIFLPLLLFLLSGLPCAFVLAGLLIDERTALTTAAVAASGAAIRRASPLAGQAQFSPVRTSATVAAIRSRVSRETCFPHSAQCNIAIAT
jgi:hypothetical protein